MKLTTQAVKHSVVEVVLCSHTLSFSSPKEVTVSLFICGKKRGTMACHQEEVGKKGKKINCQIGLGNVM